MRYVIDSSVAFKWVVPEPYSDKARQLRADYENAVHDLLAPNVFPIGSRSSVPSGPPGQFLSEWPGGPRAQLLCGVEVTDR